MNEINLFIDASVNNQTKTGYGAYLVVKNESFNLNLEELKSHLRIKRFESTSSTKLELQTLLWAFSEINNSSKIIVYTDSQNIEGLLGRRFGLEKNNFLNKKNQLLKNSDLYKEFYKMVEVLNCTIVKVKGHKSSKNKDLIDKYFSIVDKASRKAARDSVGN